MEWYRETGTRCSRLLMSFFWERRLSDDLISFRGSHDPDNDSSEFKL